MVVRKEDSALRDGIMIVLMWLFASLANGLFIGGGVNRNDVVYYPMIFACAYGLYLMGKRLRAALAVMLAMVPVCDGYGHARRTELYGYLCAGH